MPDDLGVQVVNVTCLEQGSPTACDFVCADPQLRLHGARQAFCLQPEASTENATDGTQHSAQWQLVADSEIAPIAPSCHRPCGALSTSLADGLHVSSAENHASCASTVEVMHGANCTFSCAKGHSFLGQVAASSAMTVTCREGLWSADLLPCADTDHCTVHTCNPATSECVDFKAPAVGFSCKCKAGFTGDANPGGVADGDGCQRFAMHVEGEDMTIQGPYSATADVHFRFGGERVAEVMSIRGMAADASSLTRVVAANKEECNIKVVTARSALEASLATLGERMTAEDSVLASTTAALDDSTQSSLAAGTMTLASTSAALTTSQNVMASSLTASINQQDTELRKADATITSAYMAEVLVVFFFVFFSEGEQRAGGVGKGDLG